MLKMEDALTNAIGYILILSTVLMAGMLFYTHGLPVLDAAEKSTHLSEMEQSFSVLKANIDEVALAQAPSRTSEVKIKDGCISLVNESWIEIEGTRYSLGSVEYELADRVIAYENSAVFVKYLYEESTLILAPPRASKGNVSYLPVIELAGSDSKAGEGVIRIIAKASKLASPIYTNNTTVIIKSNYYREWGRYFNETLGLNVSYGEGKIAIITFPGTKLYCGISKINLKVA
ncbi:MAG: hypothetical protein QXJ68_02200 [Methanocellales archaeon]